MPEELVTQWETLSSTIESEDWIVRMAFLRSLPCLAQPSAISSRTTGISQNDIEAFDVVRAAAAAEGIILRDEEDDLADRIHDSSTTGGVTNYNKSRKEFNNKIQSQFYVKHASSSLKIADKFSHKNPLNAEKVWQKLELKHIVQAVSNVQNSNFVICYLYHSLSETTSFVFLFSWVMIARELVTRLMTQKYWRSLKSATGSGGCHWSPKELANHQLARKTLQTSATAHDPAPGHVSTRNHVKNHGTNRATMSRKYL